MESVALLLVRLTPSEYEVIAKLARVRGCTPSDQARELMRLLPESDQRTCERREQLAERLSVVP
jgi:hypothetical protein